MEEAQRRLEFQRVFKIPLTQFKKYTEWIANLS